MVTSRSCLKKSLPLFGISPAPVPCTYVLNCLLLTVSARCLRWRLSVASANRFFGAAVGPPNSRPYQTNPLHRKPAPRAKQATVVCMTSSHAVACTCAQGTPKKNDANVISSLRNPAHHIHSKNVPSLLFPQPGLVIEVLLTCHAPPRIRAAPAPLSDAPLYATVRPMRHAMTDSGPVDKNHQITRKYGTPT